MPGLVPGRLMRPGVWAVDRSAFVPGSKLHLQDMSGSGLGFPRDPCTQIIPTLGPKVCKYYLHWAIWIPRVFGLGSESLRKFWLWS